LQVIPVDKTHNFDVMYDFLKENWEIARWVALGVVVFEVGDETNLTSFDLNKTQRMLI